MAEIRRITRSNPQSAFQNVAPATGGVFRVLADTANVAYEALRPVAIKQMQDLGAEEWRQVARQQVGDQTFGYVGGNGPGGDDFNAGLAKTESGGNYSVVNSEGYTGKYQWGQGRLDDYNRANGTSITLEQFRSSPDIQEQAQNWHVADIDADLGGLVGRVVNGQPMTLNAIRAMAHLGGKGGARRYIESGGAYNPADSNGTSLSDYARTHGGTYTDQNNTPFTPTMLRQADGTLSSRMFSPASGEFGQAYNAAAGIAYNAEVLVKGQADLMGISQQFLLDPQGFQQAARGYVDQLIKDVPTEFREELRATLDTEVQRRSLGILEDRQRDIRDRANNSSAALAENQSGQLAAAIAGGDPKEIAAARAQLQSTLYARESIPGIAWTPEQSYNTLRAAEEAGRKAIAERDKEARAKAKDSFALITKAIAERDKEARAKAKDSFALITKAASEGLSAADESILDNPAARALDPEGWAEAAAAVELREALPNLGAAPPRDVAAVLEQFKAKPITDDYQIKMVKAAETFAAAHAKAFDEDPMQAAMTYLPEKPMPLPAFDPTNPKAYIDALASRGSYAAGMVAAGYTDELTLLSKAEAETLKPVFGKDTPAELKAAMATAIVSGLGGDAQAFFTNIGADDPVLLHLGQLAAAGGSPAVTLEGFKGQELLATGQARKPTNAASITEVSPDIATAMAGLPADVIKVSDQVFQAAVAVAAARYPQTANPDSEEARKVMNEAIQSVLGQSKDLNGNLTGGVQPIAGKPTLLPSGMRGKDLNAAVAAAFKPDRSGYSAAEGLAMITGYERPGVQSAGIWPGGAPMLEGQPLRQYQADMMVLTPAGGNNYRLSLNINGQLVDARTATGQAYVFDAQALVDNWRAAGRAAGGAAAFRGAVGTYSGDPAAEVMVPTP